MQFFEEIPFIKPQNNTETTDTQSKMKNEWKDLSCLGLVFTAFSELGRLLASIINWVINWIFMSVALGHLMTIKLCHKQMQSVQDTKMSSLENLFYHILR